jgi:hypothetical protein
MSNSRELLALAPPGEKRVRLRQLSHRASGLALARRRTNLTASVLLLMTAIVAIVAACRAQNEQWVGLHYENLRAMSGVSITRARLEDAPRFATLQACTAWGNGLIANKQDAGYQCALGCKPAESTAMAVDDTICRDSTVIIGSHR